MLKKATTHTESKLEAYFNLFKKGIIGEGAAFDSPYGEMRILYADWTASGRLYRPIEELLLNDIYPFVGNTHTETNHTGSSMTIAYDRAREIIKKHVGAHKDDVLISSGTGMTGMVNKLQRILGLRVHEKHVAEIKLSDEERPVVFVTHMEHHSNQTSWIECLVDVVIIPADEKCLVDLVAFDNLLKAYSSRKTKIAAITSCSNVTGIKTPYHDIARRIHRVGGRCFVDFACSAPYIDICMRPEDEEAHLDAIYFSPHKFLGGPGTTGILIFCPTLYDNKVPDNPGGGTVDWTNPWGGHKYHDSIEAREDGGTPGFLQTIKVALCVQLKEQMGVQNILAREKELSGILFPGLESIKGLNILAGHIKNRLGVYSFYIDNLHYNLGVKLLNDKFGIQVRGGCSCAGTYGHFLLHVDQQHSSSITCKIDGGDLSEKPGWIRMSIHPTMGNEEAHYIVDAITQLAANHTQWAKSYKYDPLTNEFAIIDGYIDPRIDNVNEWFNHDLY
jgi:selenocysteine lyase/cysteine desulfurase